MVRLELNLSVSDVTRRELLAGLLGLCSFSGCKKSSTRSDWPGSFVDSLEGAGHRFRDGFRPPPPSQPPQEIPVLIIGGGVSGLTAGWQLRRRGFDRFKILEMADILGGTAVSGRSEVTRYPWGAHYVPAPLKENKPLLALFQETGSWRGKTDKGGLLFEETHLCAAPQERVFYQGAWHQGLIPLSRARPGEAKIFSRFQEEVMRLARYRDAHGRRAFCLPLAHASDDPDLVALDEISMAEWMRRRGFRSPLLDWYVAYACRDDFGLEPENTSAWYGLHYFCARMDPDRGTSAEFLTWPEGNARLVEHLAQKVGPKRVQCGSLVHEIAPHDDGRRVRVRAHALFQNRSQVWVAERVILAVPAFLRKRMVRGYPKLPSPALSYSPWLVANVHLRGRPGYHGFETAWDNVIYGSRSLGYVVATHQGGASRGRTVWTYYLPLTQPDARSAHRGLLGLDFQEAVQPVVAELSRTHMGFPKKVERIDMMRWGHAMVRPMVGTLGDKVRRSAVFPQGPLHFAHTDLSGVALFEEAFYHGHRAADEVLAAFPRPT